MKEGPPMNLMRTPIAIKGIELKNRLVMPPMAVGKADEDGHVTDELIGYYDEKTRGGYLGLVITEHCYVSRQGKANAGQISLADDGAVDGMKRLADTIHANGSKAFAQINHAGTAASERLTGCEALGPSAVAHPRADKDAPLAQAMTKADIDAVARAFGEAAARAVQAGFDGVEIHAAHGYLLGQFLSPLTNKRADEYGGSLEGRMRLHLDVIAAVRRAVGPDCPVALRLGASDYQDGGVTVHDAVAAAQRFEEAGVDLLDVSGGFCFYRNPFTSEQGYFKELSTAVKRAVDIPVILAGGVVDIDAAEALLEEGAADLIGVGRAILKDSDWAKRAMAPSA